jgi:DNA mismatch endonuclease (patch repair protein)
MADIVSSEVRARMMSGIRGRDTRPEMQVRRFLHGQGFRFRLDARDLPGRPDLVLPKWKAVVFVHGCFWHGHADCRYFRLPQTRPEFWGAKIGSNIARDERNIQRLELAGWRVAIVWECALRDELNGALLSLDGFLRGREKLAEIRSSVSMLQ